MSTPQEIEEIVHKAFLDAAKNCTTPWIFDYQRPLPGTNITLHTLLIILAAIAAAINTSIAVYLMVGHLWNWTKPREQKQSCRLIFFVVFESLVSFFSVLYYPGSAYLAPAGALYEGFAIISIFLLFVQLAQYDASASKQPSEWRLLHPQAAYFDPQHMSFKRFRVLWVMVFQIAITRVATLIASEIITVSLCPLNPTRGYASTAIEVIQGVSTGVAVMGVVQFERQMKSKLHHHRSLLKLWGFKIAVICGAVQDALFAILAEKKVFIPPRPFYISYNDFASGLPQVIFLYELTVDAIIFLWAFSPKPYRTFLEHKGEKTAGPLKALVEVWWPEDIVRALKWPFIAHRHALPAVPFEVPNL